MDTGSSHETQTEKCAHSLILALAIYEHLITFDREVLYIWQQKLSKGTLLFLANRYALLSFAVVLTIIDRIPSAQSCAVLERLYEAFTLILSICTSVFTAWRVSLIWDRNIAIFVVVFSLVSTSLVLYLMIFFTSHTGVHIQASYDQVWCLAVSHLSQTSQQNVNLATRICVLVGDTLAVVLTWMRTYKDAKELHRIKTTTLTERLMRDGTLYFVTLLGFGLAVLFIKNTTLITSILHTFTGILVTRFFLDLREIAVVEAAESIGFSSPTPPSQVSLGQANEEILREI